MTKQEAKQHMHEMTESRELSLLNDIIVKYEANAAGRRWKALNTVNWSIGHGNAIVRVYRLAAEVVNGLPSNDVINCAYMVTIDTIATIDGESRRIVRRVGTVGFTPQADNGKRAPYLLTAAGKLMMQTPQGESQTVLQDCIGFIRKAFGKAKVSTDTEFYNDAIVRGNDSKAYVTAEPFTLG